jgi:hypothetical protein
MSSFNPYKFINAAISDDHTRYFMTKAYYDKEADMLVATDGRRLHTWANPPVDFPESTYVVLDPKAMAIYPVKFEAQFPNWTKVLPKDSVLGEEQQFTFVKPEMSIPTFLVRYGVCFNYTYLKDLQNVEWTVRFPVRRHDGSLSPVIPRASVFTRGEFRSVIMPMDHTKDDI